MIGADKDTRTHTHNTVYMIDAKKQLGIGNLNFSHKNTVLSLSLEEAEWQDVKKFQETRDKVINSHLQRHTHK